MEGESIVEEGESRSRQAASEIRVLRSNTGACGVLCVWGFVFLFFVFMFLIVFYPFIFYFSSFFLLSLLFFNLLFFIYFFL